MVMSEKPRTQLYHILFVSSDRAASPTGIPTLFVATIELARGQGKNPELPEWLKNDYFQAIEELAATGVTQLPQVKDSEDLRAILSIIAINTGARIYGRLLLIYSEEELLEFESSFGS